MVEIDWVETDPETGTRQFIHSECFGGFWKFRARATRRGESRRVMPTRAMWETVLDGLERRYQRREGVDDDDLNRVRAILRDFRERPAAGDV